MSIASPATPSKSSLNPWLFVPLLYFMQATPVSLVQDVTSVIYKDLGVANEPITRWTSIIALPWSLQLLLGPLVDLTSTKRQWVMRSQFAIAASLIIAPFVLQLPAAFELSLGAFFVAAIFSALCNTAMDGYYLLAMSKEAQAKFVGVQTTCYRLGTLFAKGFLVYLAGTLMAFSPATIAPAQGTLHFTKDKKPLLAKSATLLVSSGELTDEGGNSFDPPITVGPEVKELAISSNGEVTAEGKRIGQVTLDPDTNIGPVEMKAPLTKRMAWAVIMFGGGILFFLLYLIEQRTTPKPDEDVEETDNAGEFQKNIRRTMTVVALGLGGYFAANAATRIIAHLLWQFRDGSPTGPLKGWMLPDHPTIIGIPVGQSGITGEAIQFVLSLAVMIWAYSASRRSIVGTPMGDAFTSYFRNRGIVPILAFLMFYRFGEAMVAKISPLFLKDSVAAGGLGLSTAQVGTIKGVVGVFGIVSGGLIGGWIVSKFGLRKSIWPIGICMHLPTFLYLWAASTHPPVSALYGVDFCEQFGYGFGFAGYIIYQMRVAQMGNYKTAHYALGVGIGALFIQVAGILSGILQANLGYVGFFTAAIAFGIPGVLTLFFIPLDEPLSDKPASAAAS